MAGNISTKPALEVLGKICASSIVNKALELRLVTAGWFLKTVRFINALKLTPEMLQTGGMRATGSDPYFYETAYIHTKHLQPIPVNTSGTCALAEEVKSKKCLVKSEMHVLLQIAHC